MLVTCGGHSWVPEHSHHHCKSRTPFKTFSGRGSQTQRLKQPGLGRVAPDTVLKHVKTKLPPCVLSQAKHSLYPAHTTWVPWVQNPPERTETSLYKRWDNVSTSVRFEFECLACSSCSLTLEHTRAHLVQKPLKLALLYVLWQERSRTNWALIYQHLGKQHAGNGELKYGLEGLIGPGRLWLDSQNMQIFKKKKTSSSPAGLTTTASGETQSGWQSPQVSPAQWTIGANRHLLHHHHLASVSCVSFSLCCGPAESGFCAFIPVSSGGVSNAPSLLSSELCVYSS